MLLQPLTLCRELVIHNQMQELQLIYSVECSLQLQKLRFLLLLQLRLQTLGELSPQKLQNHQLTRQLQVYQALVYFPECR